MLHRKNRFGKKMGLIFGVLLVAFLLAGCGKDEGSANEPRKQGRLSQLLAQQPQNYVVAFFEDVNSGNLVPLTFDVNSSRDVVWLALEKTLAGAPDSYVKNVLPSGIKLQDVYLENDVVNLYLTGEEPLAVEDVNLEAIAVTINFTLYNQGYGGGVGLNLFYNDKSLLAETFVSGPVNDYSTEGGTACYVNYCDSQAIHLVPVRVTVKEGVENGNYLELLKKWAGAPPKNSGLAAVVPKDTQVLSCSLENKTLMINLNKAAISYGGGTTNETIFIDSLMATLRPYDAIESVAILIEGEKVQYLPEGTDLSTSLLIPREFGVHNKVNKAK